MSHHFACDIRPFYTTAIHACGGSFGRVPPTPASRHEHQMSDHELPDDAAQKIERHRDDLADVADSDLPVAWAAEALLTIADDVDGGERAE